MAEHVQGVVVLGGRAEIPTGAALDAVEEVELQVVGSRHLVPRGGRNLVGPNLWGVVGRPKASMADYNYSAALKGKGGQWTVDDLNQFIANPKGMVPGTNMTFSGVPRAGERADIIVYLNMQSDNPVPLPRASLSPPILAAR